MASPAVSGLCFNAWMLNARSCLPMRKPRKFVTGIMLAAAITFATGPAIAAPASVNAMMVGSYYLGLFVGGIAT
jgi:hypothetical protein